MNDEQIELEEKIERCRRLRTYLTDEELRDALEELAEDYEARLKRQEPKGFMLRGAPANGSAFRGGGNAAGAR